MSNQIPKTVPSGPLLGIFHKIPHYFDGNPGTAISLQSLAQFFQLTGPSDRRIRYFDLLKDNEHFCGRITVAKTEQAAIIIKKVEILSYEQVLIEYEGNGAPETKEDFVRDLSQFPQIEEPAIGSDDSKTEEESFPSVMETAFVLRNGLEVILSKEMRSNVAGERGANHHLTTRTIEICASKKKDQLKDLKPEKLTPFYFRTSRNPNWVLAMVFFKYLIHFQKPKIMAYTGYYMSNAEAKYHLRFGDDGALGEWKKTLPLVED